VLAAAAGDIGNLVVVRVPGVIGKCVIVPERGIQGDPRDSLLLLESQRRLRQKCTFGSGTISARYGQLGQFVSAACVSRPWACGQENRQKPRVFAGFLAIRRAHRQMGTWPPQSAQKMAIAGGSEQTRIAWHSAKSPGGSWQVAAASILSIQSLAANELAVPGHSASSASEFGAAVPTCRRPRCPARNGKTAQFDLSVCPGDAIRLSSRLAWLTLVSCQFAQVTHRIWHDGDHLTRRG
jgi:hypothetical protein